MSTGAGAQRLRPGCEQYWDCVDFLVEEAAMLDDNRLDEWLAVLDPEIDYRMPLRMTRERAVGHQGSFSSEGYHLYEDLDSLRTRVARLATEYAWAEDPPSRTRRFVSNFRVWAGEESGDLVVHSNLLLRRSHQDELREQIFCGERHDTLRRHQGDLRLSRRLILLDQTVIAAPNISVLF